MRYASRTTTRGLVFLHHHLYGEPDGPIGMDYYVWIVRNEEGGNRSYSTLNEGLGKVLRYGANSEQVLRRLGWMRDVLGPTLKRGLEAA